MLTVDFDRFPVSAGHRVLDVGCGAGRHSFEALRRGARVVAFDRDADELAGAAELLAAMRAEGEAPAGANGVAARGDVLTLPFLDGAFDRVIASEILEHVPEDGRAMEEIARVLRPGGLAVVTVPRLWPERVCWALSERYRNTPGGHVRVYSARELEARLAGAGLTPIARDHAHALHSPYWWLKCAVGVDRDDHPLARAYHRLLVWDITARPLVTRLAERALAPVMGKSLVMYLRKPAAAEPYGARDVAREPAAADAGR